MNIDISTIRPTNKKVLVKPDDRASKSKGGIYIAPTVENYAHRTGTIVASAEDSGYDVGQKVIINGLAMESRLIRLNETDYVMMETDYIMATI